MMNKEAGKSCLGWEGINNVNTNHSFYDEKVPGISYSTTCPCRAA